MRATLFLVVMMTLLTGCKTLRQEVIRVQQDTCYIDRMKRDSIYLHDSIYNEVMVKGDTVWKTIYRERTHYIDRWLHDSTYIAIVDTLYETRTVGPTAWQHVRMKLGDLFIWMISLTLLGWLAWHTAKKM